MMRLWLSLFLWCCLTQVQAAVNASLDRSQITLGESVTLTLTATDGDAIGQPDLSALGADFRVLGQSSSSRFSFTNGHGSSSKSLVIQLMPKHLGTLTIPALTTASGHTQALQLSVSNSTASSNQPASASNHDLFVEASVSPTSVYVGQQATVTLKLYYAINVSGGSLDSLNVAGASVQPLGKAQKFNAVLNGRNYQVYEQQYALFPSISGKLSIPSVTFQGQALSASSSNFFGMQIQGFGMPTPVTAASNPITLKVKAKPADWKGMWLPAHKVTLGMSGVPTDNTLTVGVPLNLHLSISALGLPASSLPDLSLPDMDNASVYADKADSKTSQSGDLVKGEKSRTFAVLPQHPGSLTLPATRLTWFNTSSGKPETIELPAHTFTVVAAAGTAAATPMPSASGGTTATPANTATTPQAAASAPVIGSAATDANAVTTATAKHWRLAFFASLGLWLLLVLWLVWRARSPIKARQLDAKTPAPAKRGTRQRALQQLQQQDKQALAGLLAWASSERAGITSLTMLKLALNPPQAELIARLEGWCYAQQDFPADAPEAFAKGLDWCHVNGKKSAVQEPLAPLYPEPPRPGNNT